MDRFQSCMIREYRFRMLREGALTQEGDTFTYTGPCDLDMDLHSDGSILTFPQFRAHRTVTWTLPPPLPDVPPTPPSVTGPRFPTEPVGETLPSSLGQRKRSLEDDAAEATRARDAAGPSRVRSMWAGIGDSSTASSSATPSAAAPSFEDGICLADLEEPAIETEVEDDRDDCVELVNVESSREVVDLSSDSEAEEDPSECSSAPGVW